MSRITLDLLRKRSEHNEGEIATLEEIALHQENIEKIELIDKTCKGLKILLLQHNLVSKIENLGKLKRLEYLNLALNNIEAIENLEGLESLKKLDLTVNFIGDLRGVSRLRCNAYLEQLFLMGNPCADYDGYREYTIATLTQLKELDGTAIVRSERIKALQNLAEIEGNVVRSCASHEKSREAELLDYRENAKFYARRIEPDQDAEDDTDEQAFWKRPSRHTPEERVAIAERFLRKQEQRNRENDRSREPRVRHLPKLFSPDGKPYNVNQPKVSFKLNDEQRNDRIILEVAVYKYLDTCHVVVDVQPEYVRVTIKGKVLQLTLPCEVSINGSTVRRNTTNGKLLVTMPRSSPLPTIGTASRERSKRMVDPSETRNEEVKRGSATNVREYLEIGPAANRMDFSRIVRRSIEPIESKVREETERVSVDDDSTADVPPLE